MTAPEDQHGAGIGTMIGRVLSGLIGAVATSAFVLLAWVALRGRFLPDEYDPHGYGVIFGTVLAILAAFIAAVTIPLAFARSRRQRVYGLCLSTFVILVVGLLIAVVTG